MNQQAKEAGSAKHRVGDVALAIQELDATALANEGTRIMLKAELMKVWRFLDGIEAAARNSKKLT